MRAHPEGKYKKYGTKKLVEGIYKQNDSMLLIEDVITSGLSLLETIDNNYIQL